MRKNTGVLVTLTAGILWGFSGACGQYIFDTFGADASYLTAARMLSAGILLIIMGFFTDQRGMTAIWKDRTSVLRLVVFALGGLLLV